MIRRAYDALLLDIDGTLLDDDGLVPPRVAATVRRAHAAGVRVLLSTGRSEGGTIPILRELGLDTPAVVFNGGAVYCPVRGRMIEERVLSNRAVERGLAFARAGGFLTVTMRAGAKFVFPPRDAVEQRALSGLEDLHVVPAFDDLPTEHLMRITIFSGRHADASFLERELDEALGIPVYLTSFPLRALPYHRDSPLDVVDVHPPCRGKAEALRVVEELYGIPAQRVVAVGDASNDVPMLAEAGLGVAVATGMPSALAVAARLVADNRGDALADLVEELFLLGS